MTPAWIQTASGGAFDLLAPQSNKVKIEDVAAALGKICRFTGHTQRLYSVAEHSVRVAARCLAIAYGQRMPEDVARKYMYAGLVHDAAEAYTGDLSWPLKQALNEQALAVIRVVEDYVAEQLDDPGARDAEIHKIVKQADLELLAWESNNLLLGGRRGEWSILKGVKEHEPKVFADEVTVDDYADWSRLFMSTFTALKDNTPLPFCFGAQYMRRILRVTFNDGNKTRWFEPTSIGANHLSDSAGVVVNFDKTAVRVEFQ